ncbi:MAG: hypothetical protein ACR2QK_12480 [Acidimicrobiales bacterium]
MADTAMAALQYDLSKLTDPHPPSEVHLTAVRAVLEKSLLSSLVVLPTQGVDDTNELFERFVGDLANTSGRLTEFIDSIDSDEGSSEARSEALLAKNFIDVFREVVENIGAEAADIGEDEIARIVDERDPGDGLEDPDDPDVLRALPIRAPFGQFPLVNRCVERSFSNAVDCGGCAVIVKEFRGLQARWVLRRLTKVIEPWTSRARIINRWVWLIEFVPVEFIKTITVHCCGKPSTTSVSKQIVLDRELMTFWRCYD